MSRNPSAGFPISLSFGRSSSIYFEGALELAESFGDEFTVGGTERAKIYQVECLVAPEQQEKWKKIYKLYETIRGWKSSLVQIAEVNNMYMASLVHPMSQVGECLTARTGKSGSLQEIHCRGKDVPDDDDMFLGCRFEKGVSLVGGTYSGRDHWTHYGALSEDLSEFVVDKGQIIEILTANTTGEVCEYCPFFKWERITESIDELPDTIELGTDSLYEIKFSDYDSNKVLGIRLKADRDSIA